MAIQGTEMKAHISSAVMLSCLLLIALPALGSTATLQDEVDSAPASDNNSRSFTVGIEDVLNIIIWNEPELSGTVKVRPDGIITIPLIHDIHVDGLTPEEIRQQITTKLSQFVRDPNVTVVVDEINSYRIYFIGEVGTKGAVQLYRPMRILQAIAMAGGPTDFSKNVIILLREEYGVEKRVQIDYKKLLAGDPQQENLYLRPGDTLIFK